MNNWLTNWHLKNQEVITGLLLNLAIGPILSKVHLVPSLTTHLLQIHFNVVHPCLDFPEGLPTRTLYVFLDYSIHAASPAHLSRLGLIFLIILGEE